MKASRPIFSIALPLLLGLTAGSASGNTTPAYRVYDLGNLGSPKYTFTGDINDLGVIVGTSSVIGEETSRPMRWQNGFMTDMLVTCDDGDEILGAGATGINKSGTTVGGVAGVW